MTWYTEAGILLMILFVLMALGRIASALERIASRLSGPATSPPRAGSDWYGGDALRDIAKAIRESR